MRLSATVPSPLGPLCVSAEGDTIVRLDWGACGVDESPLLAEAGRQLAAYFDRRLTRFDLPISFPATPFQHGVMEAMHAIPFGATRTYGEIADYVEAPAQAVGQACGANPVPILIPCHRVLSATGLGGYSGKGGVETKVWLLRHEGAAGLLL